MASGEQRIEASAAPQPARSILRNRQFSVLWIGLLVSSIGDWVSFVAMMALAYQVTGSAGAVALVRVAHAAAILLVGPISGILVDRWDRKWTMVGSTLVAGVIVASLALYHPVGYVYVVYAGITAALAFFNPAQMASLPCLVPETELPAANALCNITSTVTIVLGASVGGVVVAVLGPSIAFWLDAASFLIIAALISRISYASRPARVPAHGPILRSVARELVDGYRMIWRLPDILRIVLGSAIFIFAPATVSTLAIVFVETTLHAGPAGYGLVVAGWGIGSLLGAAWSMTRGARASQELLFVVGGLIMGAGVFGLVLSPAVGPAMILYGVAGFGSMLNGVAAATIIQRHVANEYQGRVFAANSTLDHASVLISAIIAGLATAAVGAAMLIGASGLLALALGAVLLLLWLRGRRRIPPLTRRRL